MSRSGTKPCHSSPRSDAQGHAEPHKEREQRERTGTQRHHVLLSLHAGATLLSGGRPKTLPQRIDPDDDVAVATWAGRAWRGWRRAGADSIVVRQINPDRGARRIAIETQASRAKRQTLKAERSAGDN